MVTSLATGSLSILLLTGALAAQSPAGLATGMPPAGLQLGSVSSQLGAEILARVPAEAYVGLGEYVAPGAHRIRGVSLHLSDVTLEDGELFDVHVYLEQGQTNRPTLPPGATPGTTAVASTFGLTTPAGTSEHEVQVVFPTPVDVPIGSDLFVSVVLRSTGLAVRTLAGSSEPNLPGTFFDACGPALPPQATFLLLHDLGFIVELAIPNAGWQAVIDLLVDGSSGVAVTSRYGTATPTASLYSGLHPDVADPPHHTGRHDTPGYLFRGNGTLPAGAPVFLLAALDPFVGGPWLVLSPGNAVLHLSPATAFPLAVAQTDASGNALLLWPVPQVPELRGLSVHSQAFGFDLSQGAVRGGPAVRQRF